MDSAKEGELLIPDRAVDNAAAADERRRKIESQLVVVRTLKCRGCDARRYMCRSKRWRSHKGSRKSGHEEVAG
jgi:predicted metal-binding protein